MAQATSSATWAIGGPGQPAALLVVGVGARLFTFPRPPGRPSTEARGAGANRASAGAAGRRAAPARGRAPTAVDALVETAGSSTRTDGGRPRPATPRRVVLASLRRPARRPGGAPDAVGGPCVHESSTCDCRPGCGRGGERGARSSGCSRTVGSGAATDVGRRACPANRDARAGGRRRRRRAVCATPTWRRGGDLLGTRADYVSGRAPSLRTVRSGTPPWARGGPARAARCSFAVPYCCARTRSSGGAPMLSSSSSTPANGLDPNRMRWRSAALWSVSSGRRVRGESARSHGRTLRPSQEAAIAIRSLERACAVVSVDCSSARSSCRAARRPSTSSEVFELAQLGGREVVATLFHAARVVIPGRCCRLHQPSSHFNRGPEIREPAGGSTNFFSTDGASSTWSRSASLVSWPSRSVIDAAGVRCPPHLADLHVVVRLHQHAPGRRAGRT